MKSAGRDCWTQSLPQRGGPRSDACRRMVAWRMPCNEVQPVLDLLFIATTVAFFAAALAYVGACERV